MLGAVVGDVVGSRFERHNLRSKKFEFLNSKCFFTDDTVMTAAVAEAILQNLDVAETLIKWGKKYPRKGYGRSFTEWLNSDGKTPYYSFGNGAAMRVSSIGWLANSEEEVKKLSKKVTEVTHNHPEGLKGAEVTSMCVYYARIGKDKEFIKEYVKRHYSLDFDYEDLKKNYRFDVSCQGSVPQAIYCFLISEDFEDCIRTAISIGGDSDTLAAISGSIAEAYYGIPDKIVHDIKKYIPNEITDMINKVIKE